jgi:nondiscriminating aspartyl-tRNA synthetase
MERTLIGDLKDHKGQRVKVAGWISVRRDQGKMVFFDIRDRSGVAQGLVLPSEDLAMAVAKEVRAEYVVGMEATVTERPPKNIKEGVMNGDLELHIHSIEIISKAEIPFELGTEVNLDTHLDHLPFTLRSQRSRDIFTMQAAIVDAYRTSLRAQGFIEFMAPALVGGDAEGGAAAFKVDYFYDKTAYLATSPQFYKQIMVGPFERAFTIAKIFRAEKSATTRHLSEATCMDFEMGFIKDEREPMAVLETTIKDTVRAVAEST